MLMEPVEPIRQRLEPCDINPVHTDTPLRYRPNKLRFFQDSEVPRGRWPGMAETGSDVAGGHFAAAKVDRHQNLASRRMGKRVQNGVQQCQPFVRVWLRSSHQLLQPRQAAYPRVEVSSVPRPP